MDRSRPAPLPPRSRHSLRRTLLPAAVLLGVGAALGIAVPRAGQDPTRPVENTPVGDAYRAYARARMLEKFEKLAHREMRPDELVYALRTFERRAYELPKEIAREMGERVLRTMEAMSDLERLGLPGLLRNVASGGAGPIEMVYEAAEFAPLFERVHEERRVQFTSAAELPAELAPGTTLAFGPGVFRVEDFLAGREELPADLTLAGAGQAVTLLVFPEGLHAAAPLERFGLRDCTVFVGQRTFLTQSEGTASLVLERVRFVGWDRGGSLCDLFVVPRGLAALVRDCRFEGRYGTVPGTGSFCRVTTDALLARFERCRFQNMRLNFLRLTPGVTALFEDCDLLEMPDDPGNQAHDRLGVRLEDSRVTAYDHQRGVPERRDLEASFPGWAAAAGYTEEQR